MTTAVWAVKYVATEWSANIRKLAKDHKSYGSAAIKYVAGINHTMGIIHKICFDRRRCCSISGYRNVLISLTFELFTLVTRTSQYVCPFSLPQRCCVHGCSNLEVGHRFPKDPSKKLKWTVAIKKLDPSTKRLYKPRQYEVIVNAVSYISCMPLSTHTEKETRYIQYEPLHLFQ
jgi:hypothetical protein